MATISGLRRTSSILKSTKQMCNFRSSWSGRRQLHGLTTCTLNTLARQPRRSLHSGKASSSATAAAYRSSVLPDEPQSASSNAPALAPAQSSIPISRIDERKVVVGFDTDQWTRFHHVWLRDHCRCPECFHPVTKQRLSSTFDIPPDLKPARIESRLDGLEVYWPSSIPHTSFYPWSWLREHSYDPALPRHRSQSERVLWGSKIQQAPPMVSYEEVMSPDEHGLFKWLSNIDKFGFSFVSGVPPTPEDTEELSRRIAFIRETQYGQFWDFTSDLAKGDTAYTTLALSAHTDNTYFTDPCGLQLFHLLSHTDGTGGQTLLVDGFYVASILKELHPQVYDTLSRIRVPAHAAGEAGAIYSLLPQRAYPVLNHQVDELVHVRWNNDDRSVMDHLSSNEMEEWYEAIRVWHQLLTSADSEYWVQLSAGTAVVVDNHRVLHGRSAFTGRRRMCGAYIGMDEHRSKLAVLSEKFAPDFVSLQTQSFTVNGRSTWSPYV